MNLMFNLSSQHFPIRYGSWNLTGIAILVFIVFANMICVLGLRSSSSSAQQLSSQDINEDHGELGGRRPRRHRHADLSLWIDEQQVKMFSGFPMEIHAITDGQVLPYILDPNFENYLPVIPSEVGVVNFTWRAGVKKYFYHFDRLQSFNEEILLPPIVSIDIRGKIPRTAKVFSVFLRCSGRKSGIASFNVGLLIESRKGRPLNGTPLRLRLRKECFERSPNTECDKKCANSGRCNLEGMCQCKDGYLGQFCQTVLCYPQCMNGGSCIAPGKCSCSLGYHGSHCEGGICGEKCMNGGKCIQKDTCECTRGYYGLRCEYSKCMIPCLNGGRCRGVNTCRCPPSFSGDHCEIGHVNRTLSQRHSCSLPCRHGNCTGPNRCECHEGWYGRRCQRRSLRVRETKANRREKNPDSVSGQNLLSGENRTQITEQSQCNTGIALMCM